MWSKDVLSCAERYALDLPWSSALTCGWDVDNTEPGYTTYLSTIYVVHNDEVDNFRGQPIFRETVHVIPLKVRFQNSIELQTNLNV